VAAFRGGFPVTAFALTEEQRALFDRVRTIIARDLYR
jgi:hypothetical protein